MPSSTIDTQEPRNKFTTTLEPIRNVDPRDENTPDNHVLRDPTMIRLTGKHPFNAEAPVKALEQAGYVTPNQLHFVRNHGPVPQLSFNDHRLEITGLVNKQVTLTMQDILSMQSTTIPVTMVCAGNRRKEQNMVKQSIGFAWGPSGVSTACWTGVFLRDVINHFAGGLADGASYICFEGCDKTSKGGYGTSIAANRVMSDHYDILLAYKMNGEWLSPDHGYPLRVLIPGCIGGRSVKWLSRIEASENESTNAYHYHDNKVLPTQVQTAEQAAAEDWWTRPEYTLYDLNINSAITTPDHNERIVLKDLQDVYTVRGYAYTGGNRRITRVELSLDSGKTWLLANLDRPPAEQVASMYGELVGPSYYKRSRNWAWTRWHVDLEVADLVRAEEMVVRAWDESQNTQPENLTWNLMGMLNNCWFRVKLALERGPTLAIACEHPAPVGPMAGPETGGWMEKRLAQEMNTASTKDVSNAAAAAQVNKSLPTFTMAQVEAHASETDCWIVVHNLVYDCTPFLKDHPGGASSILITGGTDTTEEFDAIHSMKAQEMLKDYLIGQLAVDAQDEQSSVTTTASSAPTAFSRTDSQKTLASSVNLDDEVPFLNPKQWKKLVLESKESLSSTIRLFRFSFDTSCFGLPVGQHVYLKLPQERTSRDMQVKSVMRAYTPSRCGPDFVEFIVKIYFPENGRPGGAFTQLLDKVRVGETVDCKGPFGEYEYLGDKSYSILKQPAKKATHIGMIAGGTGITPMWQVLDAMRRDSDPPYVSLIYCARYLEDFVLSEEIGQLRSLLGTRLHVRYILSSPTKEKDTWDQGRGHLSAAEVEKHLFPFATDQTQDHEKLVLLCASDAMIENCCKPLISNYMGQDFTLNNVFVF